MKSYQYLLFDWDGNLADTINTWMGVFQEAFSRFNITITPEQVLEYGFLNSWDRCTDLGVPNYSAFEAVMVPLADHHVPLAALHGQTKTTLETLRARGKNHAVVTSSMRDRIRAAISHNQLEHLFDVVLTREDVQNHKPHPEQLLTALAKMNGTPEAALMMGDSVYDIMAGKAAGVTTVLHYPECHEKFHSYEQVKSWKSDFIIRDIKELLDIAQ